MGNPAEHEDHYHLTALWSSEHKMWLALDDAAAMFLPALEPVDGLQRDVWVQKGTEGVDRLIREDGWTLLELTPKLAWEHIPRFCERWGVPKPETEEDVHGEDEDGEERRGLA